MKIILCIQQPSSWKTLKAREGKLKSRCLLLILAGSCGSSLTNRLPVCWNIARGGYPD